MRRTPVINVEGSGIRPRIGLREAGGSYWSWLLLLGLLLCIPLAFGMNTLHAKKHHNRTPRDAPAKNVPAADAKTVTIPLAIPKPAAAKQPARQKQAKPTPASGQGWHTVTVKSGDNLTLIFSRLGIGPRQVQAILANGGPAKDLENLHPGDTLRVRMDPADTLQELLYKISATDSLRVRRSGDGFGVTSIHRTPDKRIAHNSGTIDQSLFLSARKAGLSHHMTMELAKLFGWDIDFAMDIRRGDQFTVLYEELYLDGEKIGEGDIVAAEFVNRGETYRAVRYTGATGTSAYYDPQGKSMRKAFLRTPVSFSRISSRFDLKRKHPILNRIRAHKGVDYAAPTGTPVKASGDGKIVFRGTKGGYGKTVTIEHGGRYKTLYAHLSRYARGKTRGKRVRQGEIIGYVGMTGLATGPHLHYEFLVNGTHRNPLTVKLPSARPIPKRHRDEFERQAETLVAQLLLVKNTTIAQVESPP